MKKSLREVGCFILDMDGTIYLSDELIDGAKEFISYLKESGKRYIFMTNNSSKAKKSYFKKLQALGIECTIDDIFTSGEATAVYLTTLRAKPKVYLLGTPELQNEFEQNGIIVTNDKDIYPEYVVLGFDTTLTYDKIWKACDYIRDEVEYIATHPDYNCPLKDGKYMPDTGAMIKLLEASTGKTPYVIGKPNPHMIDMISYKYGIWKSDMVVVGDRLYTDIQLAKNAGVQSVLVLSGETKRKDIANANVQADYMYNSIKDLLKRLLLN